MKAVEHFLGYFSPLTREQFICIGSGIAIGLALGVFIAWLAMHLALRRQRQQALEDIELRAFQARNLFVDPRPSTLGRR